MIRATRKPERPAEKTEMTGTTVTIAAPSAETLHKRRGKTNMIRGFFIRHAYRLLAQDDSVLARYIQYVRVNRNDRLSSPHRLLIKNSSLCATLLSANGN